MISLERESLIHILYLNTLIRVINKVPITSKSHYTVNDDEK